MILNDKEIKVPYGFKKEEQKIPLMWSVKKLEEVSSFKQGYQIPYSQQVHEEKEGYVRYLYISDFFSDSKKLYIKDSEKYYKIFPDEICVANTGNTGGKAFRGAKGVLSNNMFKISILPSEINNDFYWHFLNSNFYWNQLLRMFNSGGQPHVGHKNMGIIRILLPPLNEQEKIASILSTWDKAIELKGNLIEQKKEQKKGLMQKLLTGVVRLPGFEGKWNKEVLENVATVIMGQSPPSSSYNVIQKGLPLIQGNADCENRKTSPKSWTSQPTKTCQVGDIIMTVRAPVGIVSRSLHEACIGRGVCAIRSNINQDFLYYQMIYNEDRWGRISQGSTFESINSNDVKGLEIRVPSEKEQVAISKVLMKTDQEIDFHEMELIQLKKQKEGLMQLLLTGRVRVKV